MAQKTIKAHIRSILGNLKKDKFAAFVEELLDRREEPCVQRNAVEDQGYLTVTNVLVSTFTESKAPEVVADLLRQIGCYDEADKLVKDTAALCSSPGSTNKPKTKACVDKGDPTFRRNSQGKLDLSLSLEAQSHVAGRRPLAAAGPPPKTPAEVVAEAKARVLAEGGDSSNDRLILSRCTMQCGQYRDKTFKWLLENDVSYVARMVAAHQKDPRQSDRQDPLMSNKGSLTQYAKFYPEVLKEIKFECEYETAKQKSQRRGKSGVALVGFGKYRSERLMDLYESKDKAKISYVEFLRGMKTTCSPGSRMEDAIKYILQRDKRQAAGRRSQTRARYGRSTRPM